MVGVASLRLLLSAAGGGGRCDRRDRGRAWRACALRDRFAVPVGSTREAHLEGIGDRVVVELSAAPSRRVAFQASVPQDARAASQKVARACPRRLHMARQAISHTRRRSSVPALKPLATDFRERHADHGPDGRRGRGAGRSWRAAGSAARRPPQAPEAPRRPGRQPAGAPAEATLRPPRLAAASSTRSHSRGRSDALSAPPPGRERLGFLGRRAQHTTPVPDTRTDTKWGGRYFRPAAESVAIAHPQLSHLARATPYAARRGHITCRILAGEPVQVIARSCGTSPATVHRHYFVAIDAAEAGDRLPPFEQQLADAVARVDESIRTETRRHAE